jgi:hypothetical protein
MQLSLRGCIHSLPNVFKFILMSKCLQDLKSGRAQNICTLTKMLNLKKSKVLKMICFAFALLVCPNIIYGIPEYPYQASEQEGLI